MDAFAFRGAFFAESLVFLAPGGTEAAEGCRLAALSGVFALDGRVFFAFAARAAALAVFFASGATIPDLALGDLATDLAALAALAAFAPTGLGRSALFAFAGLPAAFAAASEAAECFAGRTFGLPPFLAELTTDRDAAFFDAFVARAAIK